MSGEVRRDHNDGRRLRLDCKYIAMPTTTTRAVSTANRSVLVRRNTERVAPANAVSASVTGSELRRMYDMYRANERIDQLNAAKSTDGPVAGRSTYNITATTPATVAAAVYSTSASLARTRNRLGELLSRDIISRIRVLARLSLCLDSVAHPLVSCYSVQFPLTAQARNRRLFV